MLYNGVSYSGLPIFPFSVSKIRSINNFIFTQMAWERHIWCSRNDRLYFVPHQSNEIDVRGSFPRCCHVSSFTSFTPIEFNRGKRLPIFFFTADLLLMFYMLFGFRMCVMLSELPDYNNKIRVGHAMSPAVILKYTHPILQLLGMNFYHALAVSSTIFFYLFICCVGRKLFLNWKCLETAKRHRIGWISVSWANEDAERRRIFLYASDRSSTVSHCYLHVEWSFCTVLRWTCAQSFQVYTGRHLISPGKQITVFENCPFWETEIMFLWFSNIFKKTVNQI